MDYNLLDLKTLIDSPCTALPPGRLISLPSRLFLSFSGQPDPFSASALTFGLEKIRRKRSQSRSGRLTIFHSDVNPGSAETGKSHRGFSRYFLASGFSPEPVFPPGPTSKAGPSSGVVIPPRNQERPFSSPSIMFLWMARGFSTLRAPSLYRISSGFIFKYSIRSDFLFNFP